MKSTCKVAWIIDFVLTTVSFKIQRDYKTTRNSRVITARWKRKRTTCDLPREAKSSKKLFVHRLFKLPGRRIIDSKDYENSFLNSSTQYIIWQKRSCEPNWTFSISKSFLVSTTEEARWKEKFGSQKWPHGLCKPKNLNKRFVVYIGVCTLLSWTTVVVRVQYHIILRFSKAKFFGSEKCFLTIQVQDIIFWEEHSDTISTCISYSFCSVPTSPEEG